MISRLDAEFLADFIQFKEEYEKEFGEISELSTTEGASLKSAKKVKKKKADAPAPKKAESPPRKAEEQQPAAPPVVEEVPGPTTYQPKYSLIERKGAQGYSFGKPSV